MANELLRSAKSLLLPKGPSCCAQPKIVFPGNKCLPHFPSELHGSVHPMEFIFIAL